MKATKTKLAAAPLPPVFPQTPHQLRPNVPAVAPGAKPPKRDNIFSKSRDTREDRGTREMKNTRSTQTLSRGK